MTTERVIAPLLVIEFGKHTRTIGFDIATANE